MDFGLSEEQELLQQSVTRFVDDAAPLDAVRAYADGGDDTAIWQGLTELGVPALLVPESAGGIGLGMLDAVVVAEVLGSRVVPGPFLSTAILAPLAVRHAGLDEDSECAELLAGIASGTVRVGAALSEAVAARRDAGVRAEGGRLTGRALMAMDAGADHWLVADTTRGLHLVAADAKGLVVTPLATVDRTRRTVELTFDATPARALGGSEVCDRVLEAGRVILAADTLGAAQRMLDKAVVYAGEREQFNRPIGSFQAVKHMCAEMAAEIEPCRALVWYAGHACSEVPDEAPLVACHAKALLGDVGKFVAKTATEVHGGMGFTDLVGLHYWFKRIGWNRQLLGAPEIVREEAARLQGLVA
ncbi:MAG TPA: acyl-CoA dehydrogenase family protein [Pseudomonadales bacterium]|nr:acyl-CoA dehydrogenase family protein [Pseudomonadales bacterium]